MPNFKCNLFSIKNKERVEELTTKLSSGLVSTAEMTELKEKSNLQFNDKTTVLVKIIETKNDDFIYRITETTNSQTPIKAFSLRANDDIQKLIEKYLDTLNISYERRINFLRNKGKRNIYSIQKLFQLFTSQVLYKPSQVKTQPKSMFIATYDNVFPAPNVKSINYALYMIPIKVDIALSKAVREYLKVNPELDPYRKTIISYGNYHLGCFMLSSVLKSDYSEKGIVNNETMILNELETNSLHHLEDALENLERLLKNFIGAKKEALPGALKKGEFDTRIVRFVKTRK